MPQVDSEIVVDEILMEFSTQTQSLGALREAAYRMIGVASCQIDSTQEAYKCRLMPCKGVQLGKLEIQSRFIDFITDENLREKISTETARTRDLIMALAFGALAVEADDAI